MDKNISYIQEYLNKNNIDCYICFTTDDHGSEYVVDHYKARSFISGFTGSAGTLVITKTGSYLWTDGRYFLQAAEQLQKTNTTLMKMGEEGVPTIYEFISGISKSPKVVFDFKLSTVSFVNGLLNYLPNTTLIDNDSIVNEIWTDRPKMVATKAYCLSTKDSGESVYEKLSKTLEEVKKQGCENALITSLDDISWLFNLRGNDIPCNPVNYAFALLQSNKTTIYTNLSKIDNKVRNELDFVEFKEYNEVYNDVLNLEEPTLIDTTKTNYSLYQSLKNKVCADCFPTTAFKAIKNATEIKNIKKAHIEDAVSMVKFMHYVKTNVGKIYLDELSLEAKLEEFRRENKNFLDLSFGTICGFGSNGAIVHYGATPETNKEVTLNNLLLVDSGAQYKFGTTDITRTFALGKITKEMKRDYTNVLKSHIALSSAIFPKGTCGYGLDMIAREPLFKNYQDFNHGTGHGVGYLLNVHEGPQRITMRVVNKETLYPFVPGMVTSDEPGIYIAGKYGIRHENLILCVEKLQNEYATFYGFEPLTYVPFDLDAIDKNLLTEEEKKWLNNYHKECYKKVEKYLNPSLKAYLKKVCREI